MPRGNSIPFFGFALGELSAGAATIPLVVQKDSSARGDDWTIAGGDTDEAENTTTGRSRVGTTATRWSGAAERNSLESGFGSLH